MSGSQGSRPRDERVPEWLLERLVANDLPEAQAADVRKRLAREPDGEARLAALRASNEEILAKRGGKEVAAEVARRMRVREVADAQVAKRSFASRFALSGLAVGALGVALALVVVRPAPRDGGGRDNAPLEEVTVRGEHSPHLLVYRKHGDKADALAPNAVVHAGDMLQVSYVSAGHRYGVIVSLDASGELTAHLPESPGAAAELERRGETALAHAYELVGNEPGFERFVFVTADVPFSTDVVAAALAPGGPPLPKDFVTTELTLRKERDLP